MSARREASRQGPPADDLSGFPSAAVAASTKWHRCHQTQHEPWFYASHPADKIGGGRWDLPAPNGTCYVAESAGAALKETAGPDLHDHGFVTGSWADARSVSGVELGAKVSVADMTDAAVSDHGASNELVGALRYRITQAWARGWHAAGLGGVQYGLRFAANLIGLGLFGPAGARTGGRVLGARSAREVASTSGVRVVEVPASRDMNILDPGDA